MHIQDWSRHIDHNNAKNTFVIQVTTIFVWLRNTSTLCHSDYIDKTILSPSPGRAGLRTSLEIQSRRVRSFEVNLGSFCNRNKLSTAWRRLVASIYLAAIFFHPRIPVLCRTFRDYLLCRYLHISRPRSISPSKIPKARIRSTSRCIHSGEVLSWRNLTAYSTWHSPLTRRWTLSSLWEFP